MAFHLLDLQTAGGWTQLLSQHHSLMEANLSVQWLVEILLTQDQMLELGID